METSISFVKFYFIGAKMLATLFFERKRVTAGIYCMFKFQLSVHLFSLLISIQ
jgi:hypothetical protein